MRKLILFIIILNSVLTYGQKSNVRALSVKSDTYIKGQSIRVDTITIPKLTTTAVYSNTYLKGQSLRVDTFGINNDLLEWSNTYKRYEPYASNATAPQKFSFYAGETAVANPLNKPISFNGQLVLHNDSSSQILKVNNTSTGVGIEVTNTNASGSGIRLQPTAGYGIRVIPTVNAGGISTVVTTSAYGYYGSNQSSGVMFYTQNTSTGQGFFCLNSSTGTGMRIDNSSTGSAFIVSNTGNGRGLFLYNTGTNAGIFQWANSTGAGHVINSRSNATNTDTVFKYSYKNTEYYRIDSMGIPNVVNFPHAFLFFENKTDTCLLNAQNTWYKVRRAAPIFEFYDNVQIDSIGGDTIKMLYSGSYYINYHLTLSIDDTNQNLELRMFNVTKNAYIPATTGNRSPTTAGDNYTIGNSAYCRNCSKNDKIILQIRNTTAAAKTVTYKYGAINIQYVHR